MPKSNFCQPKTDERLDFLREAVDGGMYKETNQSKRAFNQNRHQQKYAV